MITLLQLAVDFQELGGMESVETVDATPEALKAYLELVDAVEAYPEHEWACKLVGAIVNGFNY